MLQNNDIADDLAYLGRLISTGGPERSEWPNLTGAFDRLSAAGVPPSEVHQIFEDTLTPDCIHGYGNLKPRGYSGDFVMMERIYSFWRSPNAVLARWDDYFHGHAAPNAVRSRKDYFKTCVRELPSNSKVLNLGCGPGRDVFEFYSTLLDKTFHIFIDSIDADCDAVAYAQDLCKEFSEFASFAHENVLRFTPKSKYDLIWIGGLFDYFSDKMFSRLLRKLFFHVSPAGKIVIGNFATTNPSRGYMELLGNWYLHHRDPVQLESLVKCSGIGNCKIRVYSEPNRAINYLHVSRDSDVGHDRHG